MSLTGMWLGNFHQLRNNLARSCSYNLLRFRTVLALEKVVVPRRCILQPTTASVEERKKKAKRSKTCNNNLISSGTVGLPANIISEGLEVHEPRSVQGVSPQLKITKDTLINRGATFIVMDIETTGFSRKEEKIIEIAFRDLAGGENSKFETLVRPDKLVTNSDIHGITSEMVNRPSVPRFGELIPVILQYIWSRQIDGKPVVIISHNGRRFDIPFFISEFRRNKVEFPDDLRFVDTLKLASQLQKPNGSKPESLRLDALKKFLDCPSGGSAHRAMADVDTLAYVFQGITFLRKLTFADIMDATFQASDIKV